MEQEIGKEGYKFGSVSQMFNKVENAVKSKIRWENNCYILENLNNKVRKKGDTILMKLWLMIIIQ